MALAQQNTGVVDGLGQTKLEDLGLEAALQEVLNLQAKNVIELHAVIAKDSVANKTAEKRIALEQTAGILPLSAKNRVYARYLLVKSKKLTSSLADLGEGVLNTPHL